MTPPDALEKKPPMKSPMRETGNCMSILDRSVDP